MSVFISRLRAALQITFMMCLMSALVTVALYKKGTYDLIVDKFTITYEVLYLGVRWYGEDSVTGDYKDKAIAAVVLSVIGTVLISGVPLDIKHPAGLVKNILGLILFTVSVALMAQNLNDYNDHAHEDLFGDTFKYKWGPGIIVHLVTAVLLFIIAALQAIALKAKEKMPFAVLLVPQIIAILLAVIGCGAAQLWKESDDPDGMYYSWHFYFQSHDFDLSFLKDHGNCNSKFYDKLAASAALTLVGAIFAVVATLLTFLARRAIFSAICTLIAVVLGAVGAFVALSLTSSLDCDNASIYEKGDLTVGAGLIIHLIGLVVGIIAMIVGFVTREEKNSEEQTLLN